MVAVRGYTPLIAAIKRGHTVNRPLNHMVDVTAVPIVTDVQDIAILLVDSGADLTCKVHYVAWLKQCMLMGSASARMIAVMRVNSPALVGGLVGMDCAAVR